MKKTILMKDCKAQFHPTWNNSKLGKTKKIMGVSYVPSNGIITLKNGVIVSDCKGTCNAVDCTDCKKACYAIGAYKRYNAVTKNRIENTMQLRKDPEKHFRSIYNVIKSEKVEIVRWTESGEIENYSQFEYIINIAFIMPKVQFYMYTKNYSVLREYFSQGLELPDNMVILVSVWGDLGISEYNEFKAHKNIKCFAVNSNLKCDVFCPAYKKNTQGKTVRNTSVNATCEKCGLCTNKHPKAKIIGCLKH